MEYKMTKLETLILKAVKEMENGDPLKDYMDDDDIMEAMSLCAELIEYREAKTRYIDLLASD